MVACNVTEILVLDRNIEKNITDILAPFTRKKATQKIFSGKKHAGKESKEPIEKKLPTKESPVDADNPRMMTRSRKKRDGILDSSGKKLPKKKNSPGNDSGTPGMTTRSKQKNDDIVMPTGKKPSGRKSSGEKPSGKKPPWKEPSGKEPSGRNLRKESLESMRECEGSNDEKTGKKATNRILAGGSSASKVGILGSSEDDENGKEPGIKVKAVRKRKVRGQGIDGINGRLTKFSKLGQGNI